MVDLRSGCQYCPTYILCACNRWCISTLRRQLLLFGSGRSRIICDRGGISACCSPGWDPNLDLSDRFRSVRHVDFDRCRMEKHENRMAG